MPSGKRGAGLIGLGLCLGSWQAMAQQAGGVPPGGTIPVAPTAGPVDRLTGLPLPIQPWEKIAPFADGKCSGLLRKNETGDRFTFSWLGACRFGLAHGKGLTVGQDGKYYFDTFNYGARVWSNRGTVQGWETVYYDDRSNGPVYRRVSLVKGKTFDPSSFRSILSAIQLARVNGSAVESLFVGVRTFKCPLTTFVDAPELVPTPEQRRDAAKVCALETNRKEGGLIAFFERLPFSVVANEQWTVSGPRTHQVAICPKAGAGATPDCSAAVQAMAAPYLDEINAVIAADADSAKRAEAEITQRFRPLELAARSRWTALASSLSTRSKPRPAVAAAAAKPGMTKRPIAKGPIAKGKRK